MLSGLDRNQLSRNRLYLINHSVGAAYFPTQKALPVYVVPSLYVRGMGHWVRPGAIGRCIL